MPGELNKPVEMRCACGEPIKHPEDHPGECCDCFDVGLGMKPPVRLGKKTLTDWFSYEEYD